MMVSFRICLPGQESLLFQMFLLIKLLTGPSLCAAENFPDARIGLFYGKIANAFSASGKQTPKPGIQ